MTMKALRTTTFLTAECRGGLHVEIERALRYSIVEVVDYLEQPGKIDFSSVVASQALASCEGVVPLEPETRQSYNL
jgi:translation elongation factor EF-4